MQIAAAMPFAQRHSWSYTARTWLVDQVIEREVQQGADMIINLAAGLDSRRYRMQLPASLRWIEVDLPDMLNYKREVLAAERPFCTLERVPLDLKDSGRAPCIPDCFSGSGTKQRARGSGKQRRAHRFTLKPKKLLNWPAIWQPVFQLPALESPKPLRHLRFSGCSRRPLVVR